MRISVARTTLDSAHEECHTDQRNAAPEPQPCSKLMDETSPPAQANSYNRGYAKLRSWYLARLRQESAGINATPIARIEFDRAFMEKILAEARTNETTRPREPITIMPTFSVILCLGAVNLLCLGIMMAAASFDARSAIIAYWESTWALLLFRAPTSPIDATFSAVCTALFYGGALIALSLLPAEHIFHSRNSSQPKKNDKG